MDCLKYEELPWKYGGVSQVFLLELPKSKKQYITSRKFLVDYCLPNTYERNADNDPVLAATAHASCQDYFEESTTSLEPKIIGGAQQDDQNSAAFCGSIQLLHGKGTADTARSTGVRPSNCYSCGQQPRNRGNESMEAYWVDLRMSDEFTGTQRGGHVLMIALSIKLRAHRGTANQFMHHLLSKVKCS